MHIIEVLQGSAPLQVVVLFIAGLMVGSFLNVVIYRYPITLFRAWGSMAKEILTEQGYQVVGEAKDKRLLQQHFNLVVPRSRCPNCQHLIRWWENIPVLSYLLLRGKCSNCQSPISIRYPFVELLTAASFAFVTYKFGLSWQTLLFVVISALFIVQIFIDIDHKILPDPINYIILWSALLAAALGYSIPLFDAVIGAMAGYLSLWSFYWLFKLATKKEGMGYGDFKLLAAIGALVGYQKLLLVIILSAGVGAIIGITMMLLKKTDRSAQIPFGPYLAIAGWITLFWGEPIIQSYLSSAKL
jgi:leader peptidase (prepilin peptidase)/N-methyltransferase